MAARRRAAGRVPLYADASAWLLLAPMNGAFPILSRGGWPGVAVALALLATGCSSDSDFDAATRANTTVAWDDYLRAHPDGAHSREARGRLATLLESREWQRAQTADTSDAYQRYLRSYPQGAHAHDALVAIANLNLAAAPSGDAPAEAPAAGAPAAGTITRRPAAAPPPPVAAAPAAAAPLAKARPRGPAAGAVRVQLGAFGDGPEAAEHRWRDLTARYSQLAGRTPLITAIQTADGRTVHRLQLEGLDRAAAESLCAALGTHKDPCLVVPLTPAPVPPPG